MKQARKWAAADPHVVKDWIQENQSINQDLRVQGAALRARARDLEQNNDYVSKWLALCEINTVPIRLQSKVRTTRGKLDTRINRLIERGFSRWHRKETCSLDGRLNWQEVQRLVIRSVARDGEVIVRFVPGDTLKLAIYDADWLDENYNQVKNDRRPAIMQSIEVDAMGKPVAYYLSEPSSSPVFGSPQRRSYERVPASEILHIYKPERPNQIRGSTWMASVMIHLLMLHRYERAEMAAAEFSAKKIGFYKTPTGDWLDDQTEGDYGLPNSIQGLGMTALPVGVDMDLIDPSHPVSAYEQYVKAVLRGIATGLGVTYHALSGDLTSVSFSSIRSGTIEERDRWRSIQNWLIEALHRPVFERWLAENLTSLGLQASDFDRASEAHFQARGWQWVDPVKELQSQQMAYAMGIESLSGIAAQFGKDLEEVFDQRQKESELAESYGVEINLLNFTEEPPVENTEDG